MERIIQIKMWGKDYLNIMLSCLTYFEDAEMKFKSKCKYVYWNTLFVEIYFNFYRAEILLIRRKTLPINLSTLFLQSGIEVCLTMLLSFKHYF